MNRLTATTIQAILVLLAPGVAVRASAQAASSPPSAVSLNSCSTAYNVLSNGGLGRSELSYQRTGDVFVSCPGIGEMQLTHFGDVLFFAIFHKGTTLAVLRRASPTSQIFQLVDVSTMTVAQSLVISTGTTAQVTSTCGTGILFERKQSVGITTALDLADMSQIPIGKDQEIRCDDHRKVQIGAISRATGTDLMLEKPNASRLASNLETYKANPTELDQFDLSPNGRFIAYVEGTDLCVNVALGTMDTKRCTDLVWPAGKLTVSNDGTVLFTAQTDEACPVATTATHHAWPCEAIFSWEPEHKNTRLARFLAVDPQILSTGDGARIFSIVNARKQPSVSRKTARP